MAGFGALRPSNHADLRRCVSELWQRQNRSPKKLIPFYSKPWRTAQPFGCGLPMWDQLVTFEISGRHAFLVWIIYTGRNRFG